MCLICVVYEKGKLTSKEALRNISEMLEEVGEAHAIEVVEKIYDLEKDKFLEATSPITT